MYNVWCISVNISWCWMFGIANINWCWTFSVLTNIFQFLFFWVFNWFLNIFTICRNPLGNWNIVFHTLYIEIILKCSILIIILWTIVEVYWDKSWNSQGYCKDYKLHLEDLRQMFMISYGKFDSRFIFKTQSLFEFPEPFIDAMINSASRCLEIGSSFVTFTIFNSLDFIYLFNWCYIFRGWHEWHFFNVAKCNSQVDDSWDVALSGKIVPSPEKSPEIP